MVSAEKEAEDGFEKFDLPFDVYLTLSVVINNKIQLPIHNSWQPLLQPFFKHIDIISFSVYENSDTPEYIYATMKVRDFQYSEIRSCYAIYWTYNDRTYYTGTNTHTKGETIAPIAGYFDEGGTAYDSSIEGEINNFAGKSPIVVMDNIAEKAPILDNYDLYFKIRNYYN